MIAPDKVKVLQGFLGSLPVPMARRLAKAVEVDRLSGSQALPHDAILDALRPVLRHAEAARIATPRRLFCRPFEDLLTDRPRKEKSRAGIARASVIPIWSWLEQALLPDATASFVRDCRAALLAFNEDRVRLVTAEFWQTASAAMLEALNDPGRKAMTGTFLISEAMTGDAKEIAQLLAAGPEISELQALVPRQTQILPDSLLFQLRDLYERVAERVPDAAPVMAVIVMRRLARPWEALRLPVFVSRQARDTLISSTDMGLVGEVLFAELDQYLAILRAARHPDFDVAELTHATAHFAELSMGLVKEVEMRRDGKWGQRLIKARAAAGEALEGLLERADKEILAALPMARSSFTGAGRAPDMSRPHDEAKRERARRYARLMEQVRPFAAAVSVTATLKDAQEQVVTTLRSYNEDLLRELRAPDEHRRANGEDYLGFAAELTSQFFGPEEGEFLRRRGKSALAAGQAA